MKSIPSAITTSGSTCLTASTIYSGATNDITGG